MKKAIVLIFSALLVAVSAQAPGTLTVTLAWNANPESDIGGYRVHYRQTGGPVLPITIDVGNNTQRQISLTAAATQYEFWVTAYNTAGLESDPSVVLPSTTPALQPVKVGDPNAQIVPAGN